MAIEELPIFLEAIGRIESGGNYNAIGVPTKYGRALGKYQIMEKNWPNWARAAGIPGASWRDPKAQDHVARHMMSYYYSKYGRWDAVAVAWFAGEGSANRYVRGDRGVASRKDALGTSVAKYVEKTMLTMAQLANRAGGKIEHGGGGAAEFERIQKEQEEQRLREEREAKAREWQLGNHMQEAEPLEMADVSPQASVGDVGVPDSSLMTAEQIVTALSTMQSEALSLSTGAMGAPGIMSQATERGMAETDEVQRRAEEEANLARGREIQEGLDPGLMAERGQAAGGVSGNLFTPKGNWERNQVNAWAQQVAQRFGLRANDSYRSPAHNKRVGGAKNSDHLWGGAVDFFGPKANMDKLAAWARQHQGAGKPFRIVIWQSKGHYDHVHISFHRNSNIPAPVG